MTSLSNWQRTIRYGDHTKEQLIEFIQALLYEQAMAIEKEYSEKHKAMSDFYRFKLGNNLKE